MQKIYDELKKVNLSVLAENVDFPSRFGIARDEATDELRKFLSLIAIAPAMLAPSVAVDEMYHDLLLQKELRSQVEAIVGGTLKHDPTIRGAALESLYRQTLKQYAIMFGETALRNFTKTAVAACCGSGVAH